MQSYSSGVLDEHNRPLQNMDIEALFGTLHAQKTLACPVCSISLMWRMQIFDLNWSVFFVKQELKDQMQDCHAQNKDLAFQTIGGIRTVRSCKAENDELRRYNQALDQMCAVKTRSGIYSSVFLLIRRVRWQGRTSVNETCRVQDYMLRFQLTVWVKAQFHQKKDEKGW